MRIGEISPRDARDKEWIFLSGIAAHAAFVPCPSALMPEPHFLGIYQEAFRRAAEEVRQVQMEVLVRERIPPLPQSANANKYAVARNRRSSESA